MRNEETRRNLSEIVDYLYCPMLYYWKYQVHGAEQKFLTTLDLPKLAVQQALSIYMEGENSQYELAQWVIFIWETWLKQKGVAQDDVIEGLRGYHEIRYHQVLAPFLNGKTRNKRGKSYVEPRASKAYKERIAYFNLGNIEAALSERTSEALGVVEAEITELNLGKYTVAQAYSDSLIMAANFKPPLPQSVWGTGKPVSVRLAEDLVMDTVVDLISVDGNQAHGYFLDGRPMFYLNRSWVWRRPDLLVLGLMEAREEEEPFPPISAVYYVHLYSGEILSRKTLHVSRLQNVFIMACRGISANIYLPTFLSGDFTRCRACAVRAQCYDREDVLESAFPGAYKTARALESAVHSPAAHAAALELASELTLFDLRGIKSGECE